MEGHTSPVKTDSSYIQITSEEVKEVYMAALPDLSLENVEAKVYTSEIRREMESKMEALQRENEALKQENKNAVNALWDEINDMKARNEAWEAFKNGE